MTSYCYKPQRIKTFQLFTKALFVYPICTIRPVWGVILSNVMLFYIKTFLLQSNRKKFPILVPFAFASISYLVGCVFLTLLPRLVLGNVKKNLKEAEGEDIEDPIKKHER